jgi:DNA replication protein DnaC
MGIPSNKLDSVRKNIVENCVNCSGSSCEECSLSCSRVSIYAASSIPVTYWGLAFKNFSGDKLFFDLVKDAIQNIDEVYRGGQSYIFTGGLGTGKTFGATSILKKASVSGYKSSYVTMADIVSSIVSPSMDSRIYISDLNSFDFLVIDEFDSRWIFPSEKAEQMFGSSLEHILRTRFQNKLPTILCSNTPDVDSVLSGQFSKAFRSLRSEHVKSIVVSGIDFRRASND